MSEMQTIPARHGVATYVPAGRTIKIVNTSGSQVVDTWAFALPKPEPNQGQDQQESKEGKKDESKQEESKDDKQQSQPKSKSTPSKKKGDVELPSQEEAEKATREGQQQGEEAAQGDQQQQQQQQQQASGWSSYIPSLGWRGGKKTGETEQNAEQRKQDSRTWGSYFPSGKAFTSYVPQTATDTVSAFTSTHKPDPNKSYMEQLQAFSKTPVGAAGFSALTGSGYSGSLYAGYQAWNAQNAPNGPPMEYMSMPATHAQSLHLRPRVNDIFYSNLRQPMLTLVEDSSSGVHDTVISACDPFRYRQLGVENWEEHGSCAENLVLALKELNERAGLKGAKGVGAEVTINSVPAPLNLFMNVPWADSGDLSFAAPDCREGDYVRLRAERDVVVVMSACPNDVGAVNNGTSEDGQFLVEEEEGANKKQAPQKQKAKSLPAKRRPTQPRKPSMAQSTATTTTQGGEDGKSESPAATPKRPPPKKLGQTPKKTGSQAGSGAATPQKPAQKKAPAAPAKTASGEKQGEKETSQKPAEGAAQTNGAPVEKKKPRKLASRPKKETAAKTE
ncbi:hypothetical protein MBLNU230_g4364t1 [Neophaeotheca triangularis]